MLMFNGMAFKQQMRMNYFETYESEVNNDDKYFVLSLIYFRKKKVEKLNYYPSLILVRDFLIYA